MPSACRYPPPRLHLSSARARARIQEKAENVRRPKYDRRPRLSIAKKVRQPTRMAVFFLSHDGQTWPSVLQLVQRLRQVRFEVLDILDPDGQADQPVRDACFLALLG